MSFSKHTLVGLITLGAAAGMGAASAETISISCGAVGQELQLCKTGAEAWAKQSGHQINLISTPNSSTERLALYQQLLAAGAADIDVFQIDVIWPGTLANHLIDLKEYVGDAPDEHFSALIENNTVNDQLVAMPWYTDAGLLYYRKDLLEKYREKPPETWEQLTATAQNIQDAEREAGNDRMWGYVWQGRAYEGLTCNALEWVASHGGGTLISQDGKVTINNPNAATALDQAGSWVGKITPQGVLNYTEEEARGVFQSGNAVFMRNWPYAWALAQGPDSAIKDKVGISALPKGSGEDGQHTAALGGWQLAVSKYSKHPEIAADLVKYLTSAEEQKRRALEGAYNPTIESLYKDEEVLAANPFFGDLYEVFINAVPRPSSATGDKYNQVSKEFWSAVHSVLSGQQSGEAAVAQLENTLDRMSRGGRRW
jgi:trehalose/maltose transport system substrate-binding protein